MKLLPARGLLDAGSSSITVPQTFPLSPWERGQGGEVLDLRKNLTPAFGHPSPAERGEASAGPTGFRKLAVK